MFQKLEDTIGWFDFRMRCLRAVLIILPIPLLYYAIIKCIRDIDLGDGGALPSFGISIGFLRRVILGEVAM